MTSRLTDRLARAARTAALTRAPKSPAGEVLTPGQALRENGFTIFRGLFPPQECAELAARFKQEAGIVEGSEYTRVDSTNRFASSRRVLFDERLLGAVRAAVGAQVRFLQVSDLHYLHDTAGWHRDSVHRELDSSASADWSDGRYGVVKAILYMESDNAAMGIMAGSHLSPTAIDKELVKSVERRGGQIVIDADDEPNRRLSAAQKRRPLAWRAQVGDVLVFDERMYHAGRRVDAGKVSADVEAAKFTLSLVFGPDNHHSERLHSYFRFARRELHFKDYAPDYLARLREHDLVLANGMDNYYLDHPDELRLAHLRDPSKMDELVEGFRREGAARADR